MRSSHPECQQAGDCRSLGTVQRESYLEISASQRYALKMLLTHFELQMKRTKYLNDFLLQFRLVQFRCDCLLYLFHG